MPKSWKSTSGAVQGMIGSKTLAASTRGKQTCGPGREGQRILHLQIVTGACSTIVFFILATLITVVLFEQSLVRTAVEQGEHSRQRTVTDT